MWWLVGSLIFAAVVLILIVVGGSKLQDRHPIRLRTANVKPPLWISDEPYSPTRVKTMPPDDPPERYPTL